MRAYNPKSRRNSRGFTMLEVIAVVVILALVAGLGAAFVTDSTNAYQATQTRSKLINTGRQAVESMSRQLRVSLSYSVRITNNDHCLEFLPIVGGGYYLQPVKDAVNGVPATSTIDVAPHAPDYGTPHFVTIGAAAGASPGVEVYGADPVSRATLNSRDATHLVLSTAKTWQRNSLGQHFFLLDNPKAFCVIDKQLRLYNDQDINLTTLTNAVDTGLLSPFTLLADNVTTPTPFSLSQGSENRNVVLTFNITFAHTTSGEAITLNQSVMIRNVP